MGCTRPALRTPLSVTTSTRFAPTCCSGVATVSATPRPKLMRVGMRKTSTRVGVTRAMLGSGTAPRFDRRAGVRRRAATHTLPASLAIGAPRAPRKRLAVVSLDVRVDAHEQQRDERGEDRAPEREEEDADAARKTHELRHYAGLDDWQRVQCPRHEQDRCPRRPPDVFVREIESLLDVDRRAKLREPHDLRRLRRGDDDLTPLQRERDHDCALLPTREMPARLIHDRGGRRRAL